ncbi:hypothetical protein AHF37_09332, partial [Paragonimus kellicotti]
MPSHLSMFLFVSSFSSSSNHIIPLSTAVFACVRVRYHLTSHSGCRTHLCMVLRVHPLHPPHIHTHTQTGHWVYLCLCACVRMLLGFGVSHAVRQCTELCLHNNNRYHCTVDELETEESFPILPSQTGWCKVYKL